MQNQTTSGARHAFKKAHRLCRTYGRPGLTALPYELWKVMEKVLFKRPYDPLEYRLQQALPIGTYVTRVDHPSVLFPLTPG